MAAPSDQLFSDMFDAMLALLGPSGWWPAHSPFEMALGAILTQNTNWTNVRKAIDNLRAQELLDPERLHLAPDALLETCIRPSGFFRQKTRKIRDFLDFLKTEVAFDFAAFDAQETFSLREKLLSVRGIGPETADSILLYALDRPVFVVDAYTARICNRHGLIPEDVRYEELQAMFMRHVQPETDKYNEYHALLVRVGKEWCRKREPKCSTCPLAAHLP
ncbi:DNA-3-methyladenine glycosylase III [Desulfonatronum thiosulfatophilum]|uniref:DNA-3-methyladenine glycosylase III n=1 Tax=Desulfonatronum thiosulfatophilum TaxID=617002 RepID=A0A1G6DEQ6_9BACT|nr:endonuclease [Desulfonatronum thiosulfatophilum]SDB43589.1 DNA-3-methyladenine glycosylase III [Desulfonatronum thiosulfatophilum]